MMDFWTVWQYPFIQQALWISLILGVTCAVLSCYLVLKGWSLMSDGMAHAMILGVVLANVMGLPFWFGALVAAVFCALGTGFLERHSTLKSDTLLGILFSAMFALGIILFQKFHDGQHLLHVLFGNLLGMYAAQQQLVWVICVAVLGLMLLFGRDLRLFVFDPIHARLSGLSVPFLYTLLLLMLAFTTVAAMQAVGVVLVVSMLIAPGISAQLVTKRFGTMVLVAVVLAVVSNVIGLMLSVKYNVSTSACIVLMQALGFVLMILLRHVQSLHRALFWA